MNEHELKEETRERLVAAGDHQPPPGKSSEQADALREIIKTASSSENVQNAQLPDPDQDQNANFIVQCVNNVGLRVLMCVAVAWVGVCAFHSYVSSFGLSITAQTVYAVVGLMAPLDANQAGLMIGQVDFMDGRYEHAVKTLNLAIPHSMWEMSELYRARADANAAAGHYLDAVADLDKLAVADKMRGHSVEWLGRERAIWNQAAGVYEAAWQDYRLSESTWTPAMYREWVQVDRNYARSQWGVYGRSPEYYGSAFYVARSFQEKVVVDMPLMYSNWAACDVQLGHYQDAVQRCDRAITMRSDCSPAYKTRALAKLRLGQLDDALADCNRAVEIDPSYAAALTCRADIFEKMGKPEDAARDRKLAAART
jgi:tetratricopeptide (TPR) repeat protein